MNAKIRSDVPRAGSMDAEVDAGEHAGERGERPAEREHDRERAAHVDAERAHHRAVLDAGPDHEAEPRVAEERGQPDEHGRRDADLDEAVVRDVRAEDRRRVDHPVGHRRTASRRAPQSPGRAPRARARARP